MSFRPPVSPALNPVASLPQGHSLPAPAQNAPQSDAELFFEAMLQSLRSKTSGFVMRGWLDPLNAKDLQDDTLILCAPTDFHRDWVRDHYLGDLKNAAETLCGLPLKLELHTDAALCQTATLRNEPEILHTSEPAPSLKAPRAQVVSLADRRPRAKGRPLNPAYVFDSYITGPSNEVAYAASRAVADEPGALYSPLFLFGGTGLGKTHLLHAIGHAALAENPDLRVVYMSA